MMISTVNALQDKYTQVDQNHSAYLWVVLLSVWLYTLCFSKTSSWCRPMFWFMSLAIACKEFSTLSHNHYILESVYRLSTAIFGIGLAYSFSRKYWNRMSEYHILSLFTILFFLLFTIEGTALIQRFTTSSCDWFSPMYIWYLMIISLSLIFIQVAIQIPNRLSWLKKMLQPLSLCFAILGWIYYSIHQQYCATQANLPSQDLFSLILLVVYIVWDRSTIKQ